MFSLADWSKSLKHVGPSHVWRCQVLVLTMESAAGPGVLHIPGQDNLAVAWKVLLVFYSLRGLIH